MLALNVAMQVWPSQASHVAICVRAIVSEQEDCVLKDLVIFIFDPKVIIFLRKVRVFEILERLHMVIRENHVARFSLPQTTDISITPRYPRCVDRNIKRTRQCAQALFLYNARSLNAQIWQVR